VTRVSGQPSYELALPGILGDSHRKQRDILRPKCVKGRFCELNRYFSGLLIRQFTNVYLEYSIRANTICGWTQG
jgi:hypothetical protein